MTIADPTPRDIHEHRRWRPDWQPERSCLYWYLTFPDDLLTDVLDPDGLEAVEEADWLHPVPPRWLHVTLCDVGFADELDPEAVQDVVDAGRVPAAATGQLELTFGAPAATKSAVVLPVGPTEQLRGLKDELRAVTEATLGPEHEVVHRGTLKPHLSLGYASRPASAREVGALLEQVGEPSGAVTVDRLVLAEVTRTHRHYHWDVVAELSLDSGMVSRAG